ncbi:MAG: flagellar motor protein MotB [Oscillospiraceae bacterium]|jgi:chemotaxis protein MotB
MARKKPDSGGGANWMDTYGDMVTLLLTFFVMLYASSSFDEAKWQYILQAFTSKGDKVNIVIGPEEPENSENDGPYITDELEEGEMPQTFDQLYQYLVNYIEKNELEDSVEIEKGATNIYLKFRDNVFFGGDSDVLLDEGKIVLDGIGPAIKAVDDKILGIKICGHTAEGVYSLVDDMELSTGRAVNVYHYLDAIEAADVSKMVSTGYGKNRPVAPNDTEENRAKNRRVEIIIIRNDVDFTNPDVVSELLSMEFGVDYIETGDTDFGRSFDDTEQD